MSNTILKKIKSEKKYLDLNFNLKIKGMETSRDQYSDEILKIRESLYKLNLDNDESISWFLYEFSQIIKNEQNL